MFNWTRALIPAYYIIRSDGTAFCMLPKMENSKFLSASYANSLPCTNFMDVLKTIIAYVRPFHESYNVPFEEALTVDIIKDVGSSNLIPAAFSTTHSRNIRAACLCLGFDGLVPLRENLDT